MMLLAALLFSTVGCGEIDLPIPVGDEPLPETPAGGGGGGHQDDTAAPDGAGEGADEDDDTSDGKTPSDEAVGRVVLTSDGHLLIDDTFYFSVGESRNVVSAYNTATPSAAADKARAYKEGDLASGWRIPTEGEALLLREVLRSEGTVYGDGPLPQLNRLLEQHQFTQISCTDRLLCDEGRKTYNFELTSSISKAGSKTNYRLRFVHDK